MLMDEELTLLELSYNNGDSNKVDFIIKTEALQKEDSSITIGYDSKEIKINIQVKENILSNSNTELKDNTVETKGITKISSYIVLAGLSLE